MRGMVLRVFLLFIACLPTLGFAAGVFDVPATDKSMQYLGMVFGGVGSLPIQATGNPLFSTMVYIFNQIVFACAIVIILVTTVIGTINTAQEGEALGKKWSSIWIPARAGIGIYLLLPSVGGYNWIQITVMWFIVQGVGAANALWRQAIESNQSQGSLVADTRQADLNNAVGTVAAIFKNVVCMKKLNDMVLDDPNVARNMGNQFITTTQASDFSSVSFGRENPAPGEAPLCGTVTVPDVGSNPITGKSDPTDPVVQERRQAFVNAIILSAQALEPSAVEALNNDSSTWNFSSNWVSAARALQGATQSVSQTFSSLNDVNQKAIIDGWIHAGAYYFQLVATGVYKDVEVSLGGASMNVPSLNTILGQSTATQLINAVNGATTNYQAYVQNDPNLEPISPAEAVEGGIIPIQTGAPSGEISGVFNAIFGSSFFSDQASKLGAQITTGCLSGSTDPNQQLGDPVTCMASFGAGMASTAEVVFWSALVAIFLMWLVTSIMECVQPVANTFNFLLSIVIPIASLMLMLIWAAGISLALYVPMIPFLVFTFASLSWIILVIEAMLGAPLIALTLIIPSEDEIGKAGHAIVILLGLFLRPALMILGFIFGQKLLMVAIGMLNFGFAGTMGMTLSTGVGPFGFITIIMLYSGIAVGLVHEAFSLIYVLPDKVLRWMGAAGEGGEAGQHVKELEGSMDKGAGIGKGMMKGALAQGQSMIKK